MPRKLIQETEEKNDFQSLVDEYVEAKTREQEAGKIVKSLGAEIKSYMKDNKLSELQSSSGTRLCVQERHSTNFDEELLIEFLKSEGLNRGLVKKRDYVDFDALESAIYRGKLSEEQIKELDKFKIDKVSEALVIRR